MMAKDHTSSPLRGLWRMSGPWPDLVIVAVLVLLACIAVTWMPSSLSFFTRIISVMMLVIAVDLVTGYAGIATLGHAALYGAGAYAAGIASVKLGIHNPLILLALGMAAGGLAGWISSLVMLRAHGLSQLVISIAIVQLANAAANKFSGWTGGSDGLSGITVSPLLGLWRFDLFGRTAFILAIVLLIVVLLVLRRIMRAPMGMLCGAIRQDPVRVQAMGAPLRPTLTRLYALSGAVAGLGGALGAVSTRVVGLDSLSFELSAEAVVMMVLGGAGNLFGAVIGTAIFMWVEHVVSAVNPYHWLTVVGVLLVCGVLFAPKGLVGIVTGLTARLAKPEDRG